MSVQNWVVRFLGVTFVFGGIGQIRADYVYSDYTWHTYLGNEYAITFDYNVWADAEAEAVAVGGHLVTINDAAENAWVSTKFQGYYNEGHEGNQWASLAWIGLYQPPIELHPYDPERPDDWEWVSGQAVNADFPFPIWGEDWAPPSGPGGDGGNHAYLHTDTHPSKGTWYNGIGNDTPPNLPLGIIELGGPNPVPEPSSLVALSGLFGMGLIGLWRRRRKAA